MSAVIYRWIESTQWYKDSDPIMEVAPWCSLRGRTCV